MIMFICNNFIKILNLASLVYFKSIKFFVLRWLKETNNCLNFNIVYITATDESGIGLQNVSLFLLFVKFQFIL